MSFTHKQNDKKHKIFKDIFETVKNKTNEKKQKQTCTTSFFLLPHL